jgi:hypothetical protein
LLFGTARGSPFSAGPLPDGPHSLWVRAVDEASNADQSPAARSFTVDTAPPVLELGRRKASKTGKQIAIGLSCSEQCSVRAGGSIVGAKGLRVGLTRSSKQLTAGQRTTLALRPKGRKALRRLRRLLRGGGSATARIRIVSTDAAGNSKTTNVGVAVRKGHGRRGP